MKKAVYNAPTHRQIVDVRRINWFRRHVVSRAAFNAVDSIVELIFWFRREIRAGVHPPHTPVANDQEHNEHHRSRTLHQNIKNNFIRILLVRTRTPG